MPSLDLNTFNLLWMTFRVSREDPAWCPDICTAVLKQPAAMAGISRPLDSASAFC